MVSLPNSSALPICTLFEVSVHTQKHIDFTIFQLVFKTSPYFSLYLRLHHIWACICFKTILTSNVLEQDCQCMRTWAHENTNYFEFFHNNPDNLRSSTRLWIYRKNMFLYLYFFTVFFHKNLTKKFFLYLYLSTTILTSGVLEEDCQYMQKWAHENTQRANRAARLQNSDQQIQMAYTLKMDKYLWMHCL